MSLEPVAWEDLPSTATPLSAATLNAMQAFMQSEANRATTAANDAEAVGSTNDTINAALLADTGSATYAGVLAIAGASGMVSVTEYGAVDDGTTDNAAAIQAGIDDLTSGGGGTLFFPRLDTGVYRIDSTLNLKSNVTLRGDGAATIDYSNVPLSGSARWGIRATGVVGTPTLLSSNVARGALTAQITSSAALTVGDWALLGSTGSNYYPYGGSTTVDRGEIKQIRTITGTPAVGFEQAVYDGYATADASFLAPIAMVENVAIENLRIAGSDTANAGDRAIQFDYVNGFRINACVIEATDIYAIQLNGAIRGSVSDNRIRGVHYDGSTGQVFYAVSVMNSSQWIRVVNNHAEQVRHHTVTSANSGGQGYWGYPRFIDVVGNVAQNMMASQSGRSWAFEHHGFGDAVLFADNIADGCYGGFCARGPGVTFEGNIVRNWYQHALEVSADTVDARNIIIRDNQISDRIVASGGATNPCAILVDLAAATTVRGVVIEGNVVSVDSTNSTVSGGLHATGTIEGGLTIRGNEFTWTGSSASTSYLVRTYLPATVIEDNKVRNSLYGFRATGNDSDVSNNYGHHTSQQASGALVYVDGTGAIVTGNRSRKLRYCVQSAVGATGAVLVGNVGVSTSDPFGLGVAAANAKVNVWTTGSTGVNT